MATCALPGPEFHQACEHPEPRQPAQAPPLPLRAAILMDHPSPHMTPLLQALADRTDSHWQVLYCGRSAPGRRWGAPAGPLPHQFVAALEGPAGARISPGILRAMRRIRADAWVVNTVYTSPATWLAVSWLKRRGLPWAYMNEPPRPRCGAIWRLRAAALRSVLRHAWAVIGTGAEAEAMYRRLLPRPVPTESVPYYAELEPFLRLPLPQAPAAGQDIEFLASGSMVPRKGFDMLLEACELLPSTGWRLTLCGDGPLRRKLEGSFRQRCPGGKIRFAGELPYADRASAFAGKHALLFPSRWDGWGMVVPEALGAGLPVVSTDRCMSAHEFICDGENGFIVPSEETAELADRMNWFLRNRQRIPAMAAAARQAVTACAPADGASRLFRLLASLAAGYSSPGSEVAVAGSEVVPDWKALTVSGSRIRNLQLGTRTGIKSAIARISLAAGSGRKPGGNRILVYHLVLREDHSRFEEHLNFLADHFEVRTLGQLLHCRGLAGSPRDALAITFDDGFRVIMGDCLDLLEKHAVKATFFVPTGFLEAAGSKEHARRFSLRNHGWKRALEPMRVGDLQLLVSLGHEIGSHGVSHASLADLTERAARLELSASRSRIRDWIGIAPVSYAYPYGETASSVGNPADWLRAEGYSHGVTLKRGAVQAGSDPLFLPRDHAEGNWPVHLLRYFLLMARQ